MEAEIRQNEKGLRHINIYTGISHSSAYTGVSHSSASEGFKTGVPVFTYPSEAELCEERVRTLFGIAKTPLMPVLRTYADSVSDVC